MVEGHEGALVFRGHRQQIEVGDLPGAVEPLLVDGIGVQEAHDIGPKLVLGMTSGLSQTPNDRMGWDWVWVGGLGHHPNTSVLRDRA